MAEFLTSHVEENEIVKANDFEFAFENLVTNVSKATQMFLESRQDFVINGEVLANTTPDMFVRISPIFGVCKSTGVPFGNTEMENLSIGFESSSSDRVAVIEVKGEWEEYDEQQRAFNDPDTDTQTYRYVNTKKRLKPVYQIIYRNDGSSVAPDVDTGWVKLAEVVIRANATQILDSDIKNITSDIYGLANEGWTNQVDATYNIGYISAVNRRFREQHNEDGTHKNDVINSDSLNIGTGSKQINGKILPVGQTVSIPTQTIAATDSIWSVLSKITTMLTSLYNVYLKFGNYNFNGELAISDIADANNALTKPLKLVAAGNGTAVLKIGDDAVLSIDANGRLSTNGYTANANNNLITKAVTDAISLSLSGVSNRVTALENNGSAQEVYINKTLSASRYTVDDVSIIAATTSDITLSGSQTVDGVILQNGQYVLVKNQTDAKENGLYQYSSNSSWSRVTDYNSPNKMKGKLFIVTNGTTNSGKIFYLPKETFTNGADFGTDDIEIVEYFGSIAAKSWKTAIRNSSGDIEGNVTGSSASCTGNASTATKLATARQINGTSFNGSADITTTQWGTARNITIKDSDGSNSGTATSVDGSAAVTLLLPSTIKATITGNCSGTAASAGKLTTARKVYVKLGSASTSETKDFSGDTAIPVDGTLAVANGGTGSSTAAGARTNLGLGSAAVKTAGNANGYVPLLASALTIGCLVQMGSNGLVNSYDVESYRKISNGGAVCSTAKATQKKEIILPGITSIYTGMTVKVLFTNGNSAANPTLWIKQNSGSGLGVTPYIKVVKAGSKVTPTNKTGYWRGATSTSSEMWQPYTTLELMYDGTDFVIIGNPVVEDYFSDSQSYTVYANGLIEQWYRLSQNWTNPTAINFDVVHTQNPIPTCSGYRSDGEHSTDNIIITNISTSSITIRWHNHGADYNVFLKTIGY